MTMMLRNTLLFPLVFALAQATWRIAFSQNQNQNLSQEHPFSPASTSTVLEYHGGPLLTGPKCVNIYLIWYGDFARENVASITDFFVSINPYEGPSPHQEPTVAEWWRTIQSYEDTSGNSVSSNVTLVKQVGDMYSLGKNIKRAQIANIIKNKIEAKALPLDSNGIYVVLTAEDVAVDRFCMGSCGLHDSILVSTKRSIVYGHVGNSLVQCPGLCAWPFAVPAYGSPSHALVAPNGVANDGMVINIATILVGAVTNPYKTGYFQGDALAPLEAVTACTGIFGAGAYPGFPGKLLIDKTSKASYNVYGNNGRKFLLPAIWNRRSLSCKVMA